MLSDNCYLPDQARRTLSVVIPVHNDAPHLRSCLEHLRGSSVPFLECIVMDDASTDDSAAVGRELGAAVSRLDSRGGPARARNLGATMASGDILLFLDADVCVYPDTLERILRAFEEDPELDALIGSYDDSPQSQDFLSQYRNLMHCFVHQHARRNACTFWSGCGAIRRDVFLEHAGFDEAYGRPAVEDIELGSRLIAAHRKIILDKNVLVKHLKRWTFWGLLKTDIRDRGIPWTELILRERHMPNDLNLELSQRVSVALAFVLIGLSAAAAIHWRGHFLTPTMAILFFLLARYWLEPAQEARSATVTVVMFVLLGAIVWQAYTHRMLGIVPPVILGYLLLFLQHRYAYRTERARKLAGLLMGVYIFLAIVYMLSHLPAHMLIFAVFVVAAAILVLNTQFYLFLAARQGRLFALAAVPFHVLYHLYNGLSFLAGSLRFAWRSLTAHKTGVPEVGRGGATRQAGPISPAPADGLHK